MNNHRGYRIVFLVVAGLLVGFFISRHFAIQNAIQGCDSFHLRAVEQPFNIQAQFNTYTGACKILDDSMDLNNPGLPVWLVTLNGKWTQFGGPTLVEDEPSLEPVYFNECAVIVNALTGRAMGVRAQWVSASQ